MTGDELLAALARLNMTQTELARLLAAGAGAPVPPGTVNRWCKGARAIPAPLASLVRLMVAIDEDGRAHGRPFALQLALTKSFTVSLNPE